MTLLSTDKQERKNVPIGTGVLDYFPRAMAAVAHCSKVGNDQHNPGQKLHWNRGVSEDHDDCLIRHFLERGTTDTDGVRHSAKVAWRALAMLEAELEKLEPSAVDMSVEVDVVTEYMHQTLGYEESSDLYDQKGSWIVPPNYKLTWPFHWKYYMLDDTWEVGKDGA